MSFMNVCFYRLDELNSDAGNPSYSIIIYNLVLIVFFNYISLPTLIAQTEVDEEALKDEMARQYKALQTNGGAAVYDNKKKHKGIKRFFGK